MIFKRFSFKIELVVQQVGTSKIEIGWGGMAAVDLAYDSHLNYDVAIKFIRSYKLNDESHPNVLECLTSETQKPAQLNYPHIVAGTDFSEFEGIPCLVMRYIPR